MIIKTRLCVVNKYMSVGQRSSLEFALKLCAQASVKPVPVRPIILSCMVGFENNLVKLIIMTRGCVASKNHVTKSKIKATVRS